MNLFSPAETVRNYCKTGKMKAERETTPLFLLAVLAGFLIALGGAVCSVATCCIENASLARIISGLLFPFGLGMVMLTGAELFTGNCLISITALNGETSFSRMLRNWGIVYLGNFAGSLILAAGCAFYGQFDFAGGALARHTMKVAAAKCALPFSSAIVLGIFCNVLVCLAVLCSLSAQDAPGRVLGAYLPVACFVLCGFEHCVANMFFIPAGLFARMIPAYARLAAELDLSALTWGNFLLRNLLPVTIGNIAGGVGVGIAAWRCHLRGNNTAKCGYQSGRNKED